MPLDETLTDLMMLISLMLLFVAVVCALVDAFMEEIDLRYRVSRSKDHAIAEGATLRDQLFMVRHIPSMISAGVVLMMLALTVPRLLA